MVGGVGWRRVVCCLLFVGVCWLCVCVCVGVGVGVCVCVFWCVCVGGVLVVVCVDFSCYSLSHPRK